MSHSTVGPQAMLDTIFSEPLITTVRLSSADTQVCLLALYFLSVKLSFIIASHMHLILFLLYVAANMWNLSDLFETIGEGWKFNRNLKTFFFFPFHKEGLGMMKLKIKKHYFQIDS